MRGATTAVALLIAFCVGGAPVAETAGAAEEEVPAPVCEGDDCQVPPPAPVDPVPATAAVEGPANPPVRFPARRGHKHHHRRHSAGRERP